MEDKINKIRKLVQENGTEMDWKYHIALVVKHAKGLAKKYGADEDIVELAALLHDIGRLKYGPENHHITGAEETEKILKGYGFSEKTIKEVKYCVLSHRGSLDIPQETLAAKIVCNADAMSHFDVMPIFFYWRSKEHGLEEIFNWVDEKIERDWNEKLTLPKAKKMVEENYKAIKRLLDILRACVNKEKTI